MVSHICLLVELVPICNSMAASLCLKSCEDHSLLKSYNGGLWKNIYWSGPLNCYHGANLTLSSDVDQDTYVFRLHETPNLSMHHLQKHVNQRPH